MKHTTDVAILGAGLAGLSTAYHLDRDYLMFDQCESVGGLCGSRNIDGFILDPGPHLFFSKDAYIVSLLEELLGGNLLQGETSPGQYFHGTVVPYPYTVNLYGLPADVIDSCLTGYRDALKSRHSTASPKTYHEWCYNRYGSGFAEHFMLPYARNYWAVDPMELNTDWIGDKILQPNLQQVESGAKGRNSDNHYYYSRYLYPRHGGCGALSTAFLDHVKEPLTCMQAEAVDPAEKIISFTNGSEVEYADLVSTLPAPVLVSLIKNVPKDVERAAGLLRCNSVLCILVALDNRKPSDYSWIYFNDGEACFYRVSFPEHFSPNNVPQNKGSMWVEVSCSKEKRVDKDCIVDSVVDDLYKTGLLSANDKILFTHAFDLKYAYVIYDKNRKGSLDKIYSYLGECGIRSCGRFAEWAYLWTHEIMLRARSAAEELNRAR